MTRELTTLRGLTGLMLPGSVLLLATWAFQQDEAIRSAAVPYAIYYCYGALATAALLSWYYDYARLLFVSLAITIATWSVGFFPIDSSTRLATIFLLPLNFIIFVWLKERGVLTINGLLRSLIVLLQVVGLALLHVRGAERLEAFLQWGQQSLQRTWMSWALQASFFITALVLIVLIIRRRTKLEQGLLWGLVVIFLGLNERTDPDAILFYAGTSGVILVFAVLEHGYDIAYRDELTGLPGRRAFNHVVAQLRRQYAIAICDVDHFKKFNDTYGHDAGDQVLKMVASKLSRVGGGGRPFRYGGEEFIVVFKGRSAEQAHPFAESLRKVIADTSFALRGLDASGNRDESQAPTQAVSITISIGVAEHSKRFSAPELVLDAADTALYRAKESGRNCVKLAESDAVETAAAAAPSSTPRA